MGSGLCQAGSSSPDPRVGGPVQPGLTYLIVYEAHVPGVERRCPLAPVAGVDGSGQLLQRPLVVRVELVGQGEMQLLGTRLHRAVCERRHTGTLTQMAALHAQGSPSRAIMQPGWRCKCLYTGSSYLCPSSPRPLLQCFPDEARTRPRWAAAWRSVCEGDGWEHAHLRKQMCTSEGEQRE